MFNNYDYIYVHYISHSAFGAILPKITSKNTKLVLNAHGNDVAYKVIVPSNYFKKVLMINMTIM